MSEIANPDSLGSAPQLQSFIRSGTYERARAATCDEILDIRRPAAIISQHDVKAVRRVLML
jgi:hypothetical protein